MIQDVLLLAGVCCLVGGVAMINVPSALILFGALCFAFVYLIEVSRRTTEGKSTRRQRQKTEDIPPGILNR